MFQAATVEFDILSKRSGFALGPLETKKPSLLFWAAKKTSKKRRYKGQFLFYLRGKINSYQQE